MKITNNSGINLTLAVWLLHDEYDYVDKENYISVTSLMRPLKQTILAARIPNKDKVADVEDYVARTLGKAIHDSMEKAWTKHYASSMRKLGYPEAVIQRIRVNPEPEDIAADSPIIPVYLEQRAFKDFQGFCIGGKFDMVAEGIVQDNKSTSAYSWLFGTRDDEHILQLSLYKWLNPDKITADFGQINYIFTDWAKAQAKSNPKYPQKRIEEKRVTLMDTPAVEQWVSARLTTLKRDWNKPEEELAECTDEELWRSAPAYKYYADPTKTARSTKNFETKAEADAHCAAAGKGIVKTIPGEVKACGYCPAYDGCKQKDRYFT